MLHRAIIRAADWPQRAVDRVRPSLAKVLRDLARLVLPPEPSASFGEEMRQTKQVRRTLPAALDATLRVAELSEGESDAAPGLGRGLPLSALPVLVAQAQDLFLIANSLATQEEGVDGEKLAATLPASERSLRRSIADQLRATADLVERRNGENATDLAGLLQAWREHATEISPASHRLLLERLATRSLRLQRL